MSPKTPTALIAEDEPLLALALQAELAQVWPALQIAATVGDGLSAVAQALALRPDVLFFDIRMPGQNGLEAAAALADAWPLDVPFPALVFVTAYDQYAVAAFDTQAVDYVLKPVQRERLHKTAQKVQRALEARAVNAAASTPRSEPAHAPSAQQLAQLAALLAQAQGSAAPPATPKMAVIQASASSAQGAALVMVPVEQVLYFEAADKYLRVVTPERELLIRTPLKDLLPQLDTQRFWQIHRGTVVRADAIASASRDEAGKLWVHLQSQHHRPERLAVSRLYAHLFKAM